MTRAVKLGRKVIFPPVCHWAVKVGDTWYEIAVDRNGKKSKRTRVNRKKGKVAKSGAGRFGGELAGETKKTDDEIKKWTESWVDCHPDYGVISDNCQKFAYEFMDWLTDGNFICPHIFDAASFNREMFSKEIRTFARKEDGNAIARLAIGSEWRDVLGGFVNGRARLIDAKGQAVFGPGVGAWADASLLRLEASVGNVVGVHIDVNANTGAGFRNGNLDVHFLGIGCRIGADGISLDTPGGGVNACNIM